MIIFQYQLSERNLAMFNMQSEQLNPHEARTMAELVPPKQLIAIQDARNYRSIKAEQQFPPVRQPLYSQVV
jgi:hypothetical protein